MIDDALFWHRLQFAFTVVFHYLFPQLTMGIAWFLVGWKWFHLRTGDACYGGASRLPVAFAFALTYFNFIGG
jgi:cytochrome d ubiquinol oxidase subunit I